VRLADGSRLPDPILSGPQPASKVEVLAAARHPSAGPRSRQSRPSRDKNDTGCSSTQRTAAPTLLKQAIAAGKHIYCEKPVATNLAEALDYLQGALGKRHQARRGAGQALAARDAEAQDAQGLRVLRQEYPYGARRVRLLGVRGRLAGELAQRRALELSLPRDGGGIILDMLCHWRYVLDNLFREVRGSLSCLGATHI
jgi:hypothetical protein